ncbi:MAG: hypothetical protein LBH96_05380 [Candidatus Peribacteria bacterium]|nr:hypothetical protein [Candidatus Peribacteria bacterium]
MKFTASDKGDIELDSFIKFHRNGYYRLYVEDNDGNYDYVQFTIEASDSNDDLAITTNRKKPSLNQWVNVTITMDDEYRGDLDFYVSYRTSSSSSRGKVSSSSYFTAHDYFNDGYRIVAADKGKVTISSFIRFNRSGYFRVYVQDKEGNNAYVEFDLSNNTDTSDSSESSSDTTSSVRSEYSYTATNCKVYLIQYLDS